MGRASTELHAILGERPFDEPYVYSYPGAAGSTFEWVAEGGAITEGQGTNEVYVVTEETGWRACPWRKRQRKVAGRGCGA